MRQMLEQATPKQLPSLGWSLDHCQTKVAGLPRAPRTKRLAHPGMFSNSSVFSQPISLPPSQCTSKTVCSLTKTSFPPPEPCPLSTPQFFSEHPNAGQSEHCGTVKGVDLQKKESPTQSGDGFSPVGNVRFPNLQQFSLILSIYITSFTSTTRLLYRLPQ